MIKIKIDNKEIEVPIGTSILQAAALCGTTIPTLCHNQSVPNHASCMVCAVKNNKNGEFIPSCEVKVQAEMDLSCNTDEVFEFRKDALELLLSDHIGDCEAPCRVSCPAFMDIPQMNRLIAIGDFSKALKIVKEEIALPMILGFICPAPCEGGCRRKPMDGAVSICQLKKFVALEDSKSNEINLPENSKKSGKKVAIIGTGMAGLSAAFHILKEGHACILFDKNLKVGGALLNVPETEMPKEILEKEIEILSKFGAEFRLNSEVRYENLINDFDAVILATGENSKPAELIVNGDIFTTNIPKVFVSGSVIKPIKMSVKVVAQGKATAHSVNAFLSGKPIQKIHKQFNSRFGRLKESENPVYLPESVEGNRISPANGEILGLSKSEAMAEALRCMRCDCRKLKTCQLRIQSDFYKADQRTYWPTERKTISKFFYNNILVYEPEKCIKCGLCIEVTGKDKSLVGLTFMGRGFDMKVDIPFKKNLEEAVAQSALECIEACPTGALAKFEGEDNLKISIRMQNH